MRRAAFATGALALLSLACVMGPSGRWTMPTKASARSAVIFGAIEQEDERPFNFRHVNVMQKGKVYVAMGSSLGEKVTILDNDLFIAPKVEPGTYFIPGFNMGSRYHGIPEKKREFFEVRPGELKFVGSFLYHRIERGPFLQDLYTLDKIDKPTERELVLFLAEISEGTGWEKTVARRIHQLGGKPPSKKRGSPSASR